MKCLICGKVITNYKGIASHLRSAHNITNKQYYDKYLKKPREVICKYEFCDKPTKFYSIVRGYLDHCCVKHSSLDNKVQEKLNTTCEKLYGKGITIGFKTTQCIKNSHTKEALQKVHDAKIKNGWTRSKLEELVCTTFDKLSIIYKHNYTTNNYPWKCDFYLPNFNLYIEINAYWTHGGHYFNSTNKDDLNIIEYWKNSIDIHKHTNAINTWTISDIQKRDHAIKNSLNYVVLWNKLQVNQFLADLESGKQFNGFIDYNCLQDL